MKYCVIKGTAKPINSSNTLSDEILIENALSAGISENEVEIITEEEYLSRVDAEPKPPTPPTLEERIQALELMELGKILGGM